MEGFGRYYWEVGKVAYQGMWRKGRPSDENIIVKNLSGIVVYNGKNKNCDLFEYLQ